MSELDDLLIGFIEDSQMNLQSIEPDLLALENSGDQVDAEVINRIFRSVHSIKGAAGFFGLQNIGRLSHTMENTLSLLRDKKISPSPRLTDALLSGADALKAMIDDVSASENFDLHEELGYLQKILDEHINPAATVTISEKKGTQGNLSRFDISEAELRSLLSKGFHLYAVRIFLNKDLRDKKKRPFDFINNMESVGRYVDSFLDIMSVSNLSDCLDNELAFDFLFATILEKDLVPTALELPADQVREIDVDEFRKELISEPPPTPLLEGAVPGREDEQNHNRAESEPPEKPVRRSVRSDEKIRVSISFLNEMMNLAGELVLGRNQLLQIAIPLTKTSPDLGPILQHISRITSEMQEKVMLMRMQPMSLIFGKFPRVVRDLAKSHSKEVKLITQGEEVELDKSIIEGLSDPLTHLIRNAIDHGIESPEAREKIGKPRHGTIRMKAYHQGGQVVIEISDDGRGIDGNLVAKKAFERGLIAKEQMKNLTDKERIALIFQAGFSTLDQVSDLSGRGVGMDVVRTNIGQMGGTVSIETETGKSTTIRLILPLTLAIVSGLLVQADGQLFILPEADVEELVRVKSEDVPRRIGQVQNAWVLRLRDTLLPLADLNKVLGFRADTDIKALQDSKTPVRIVVIRHGRFRFGLIVEAIANMEEIVVKPLPKYLKKLKTFSGVSILGNGKVSLILDIAGVLEKAGIRDFETEEEISAEFEDGKEVQTFLLFHNGTQEQFALPLELISRIERIRASQIERIKDKLFLQYQQQKLRLVFLEDYLPISRPDRLPDDMVSVIIPKQIRHPMGIVMNKVINTMETSVELDTTTIMAPGLFGSAVMEGKITLLPDMYRLFEMAAPEWYKPKPLITQMKPDRKPRVLLAEDTPFFRMIEGEYLSSAGYEVLIAENGRKAIEILEEEDVDAVILDIVMPEMDGIETIKAIRADDRLKHLPVMAVTSLGESKMIEEGLKLGFNEWELKLDKVRLLEKLAKIIKESSKKG